MTVYEILEAGQYNLNENGQIGLMVGRQQLNHAMRHLENGKELSEELEDE